MEIDPVFRCIHLDKVAISHGLEFNELMDEVVFVRGVFV